MPSSLSASASSVTYAASTSTVTAVNAVTVSDPWATPAPSVPSSPAAASLSRTSSASESGNRDQEHSSIKRASATCCAAVYYHHAYHEPCSFKLIGACAGEEHGSTCLLVLSAGLLDPLCARSHNASTLDWTTCNCRLQSLLLSCA